VRDRARTAIATTLICCFTCALFLSRPAHALDPNLRLTQYMHTSWRIQDGSVSAGMFSVAQTADGFLWLTSVSQGMYRFDGIRFVPWTLTVDARTIDHIVSVHGDRAGGLWAVGEHEVFHLKGGVVTAHFALEAQFRTANISEDPDGSLWILDAGFDLRAPLCHITEHEVKCFGESEGIPLPTGGQALLADGKGGFWLGGQRAVVHWHGGVSEVYPIEALQTNSGDGVNALALDSNGSLWIGLLPQGPGKGLGRLDNGAFKSFVNRGLDGSKLGVFALTFDRDGSLWVGTLGNGLFRIRGDVVEHYGRAEGLSSDFVNDLFEDREGILWVTTTNGIDSFRDPRVVTFSTSQGLGKEEAVGVLASRDGTVWVANAGSLDKIENGTVTSIRSGQGLPGDQVSYMLEDRAGNLWIGVYDGLYVFTDGRFRRIPEPDHQPLGLILGMAEDVDGDIWAVCSGVSRKLIRIRDFQVREQLPASQVPMGRIAPDPHGGIWIGPRTKNGTLILFRDGVQKAFPTGSAANLRTNHLIAQADGSVMASFDDGLVGLRQGKAQRMTTKNGLPCNAVYSFIEDKQKTWWLLTECGIVELPDSELQRWWANPEAVVQPKLYDVMDGARPGRYGIRSADVSPDGRVWFATGFVLQMVDPTRGSQAALAAPTYIESVTVDRRVFAATEHLGLAPQPRDLQIDYTSPTFTIPQKVKFRYRLDPYDSDWHDAGTRRQAFYSDLPPGNYAFRVIAANSDSVWTETAAKLDFSIAPAYFQTYWFRALCAALVVTMLWMAYRLRVRHLQRRFEMTLRAEEKLREKDDALEMARTELARVSRLTTLGELTASIAHEVSQPLGAMVASAGACARWLAADPPEMAEARSGLDNIVADGKRAREVIARIRALTKRQAPRMDLLDLNREILEVLALTEEEVRSHDIVRETKLVSTLPQVMGDRVQLQQVLLNLILNAIDAMSAVNNRARQVTIVSAQDAGGVVVEVRDSGIGLDEDRAERVFDAFYTTKAEGLGIGLSISRSIVEAHGGRLWAASNQPHGAVFGFCLPAAENRQS
jgi:signal transduction histidine kinase/ligand-binding sensor domain-containing protein